MSQPIIETTEGKLMGILNESENGYKFYTFKNIPYAKPPINELRFAVSIHTYSRALRPYFCCIILVEFVTMLVQYIFIIYLTEARVVFDVKLR